MGLLSRLLLLVGLLLMGLAGTARAQAPRAVPSQAPALAAATARWREGVVVFRLRATGTTTDATGLETPALVRALAGLRATTVERAFPHSPAPTAAEREREPRVVDLTPIYRAYYTAPLPVPKAAALLRATGAVQYAEPDFLGEVFYLPNDSLLSVQLTALNWLRVPEAWDTQKGDSTVLIGIVDTGVDFIHPDLAANVQRNYADPINGLDDDLDGYVDNYHGWDMAGARLAQPSGDNNPYGAPSRHGTQVAGCAAAVADNTIGVAGVGFHCRLLPVKCSPDDSGYIINGYGGIVYAADHGCDIINCSWGIIGFPDLGQDVINYATFNRNALVVAAAGNTFVSTAFSPADYESVLAVGGLKAADRRANFSNFGVNVDVCAPGVSILATVPAGGYGGGNGTSFASPLVAGVAGLVKAQFPAFSAEQVGQQIRMTCDSIDHLNASIAGLLGRGRVNAERALLERPSAVRFHQRQWLSGPGGAPTPLWPGTTVVLAGAFRSFLKPTRGLTVTLTSNSSAVSIAQPTRVLGRLGTGQAVAEQFAVSIGAGAPANEVARFTLTYSDSAGYADVERFEVYLNPPFHDLTANRLHTSLTDNGRIGFTDYTSRQGLGLVYRQRDNLIWELGLLIGTDSTHVSNSALRVYLPAVVQDDHLRPLGALLHAPAVPRADQELVGMLTDAGADSVALPVHVRVNARQWATPPHDCYILLTYTLLNPGAQPLTNLYAGLYADWDIDQALNNKADWDATRNLGYAYATTPDSAYAGIRLLAPSTAPAFRAIDWTSARGNPWAINDGFTLAEKWRALSRGVSRTHAGGTTSGGTDVCTVHGAGPFTLLPGDSVTIAFALIAGDSLAHLQASADAAQAQYQQLLSTRPTATAAGAPYPNPSPTGGLTLPPTGRAGVMDVLDARGARVLRAATDGASALHLDLRPRGPGLYQVRFTPADGGSARAWRVVRE